MLSMSFLVYLEYGKVIKILQKVEFLLI